jgi:hypothetical protein
MRPSRSPVLLRIIASLLVATGLLVIVLGLVAGPVISSRLYQSDVVNNLPADKYGYVLPSPSTGMDGTSVSVTIGIVLVFTLMGASLIANGEMILMFIAIHDDVSIIRQAVEHG